MQMKQILLTVALVATGILLYDLLRAGMRSPAPEPASETAVPAPPDDPRLGPSGRETVRPSPSEEIATLRAELAEARRRIIELEGAWGAMRTEWQGVLARARSSARVPPTEPDAEPQTPAAGTWPFSPEEEAAGLRMIGAAEQARKRQRMATTVAKEIEHLAVELTAAQRQEVIAATLAHRARTETILTQLPSDVTWDERARMLQPVYDDFVGAVDRIVDAASSRTLTARLQYLAVPGAAGQDPQMAAASLR